MGEMRLQHHNLSNRLDGQYAVVQHTACVRYLISYQRSPEHRGHKEFERPTWTDSEAIRS